MKAKEGLKVMEAPKMKEEEKMSKQSGGDESEDEFHDAETQAEDVAHFKSHSELCFSSLFSLKNQLQIKDDESFSKMKQDLRSTETSGEGKKKEPEVQILSLSILSPGRPDLVLTIPFGPTTSKSTLFTLKQGSKFRIKFHFIVSNEEVSGLNYTYDVWKAGLKVNHSRFRMGAYKPQREPHTFELEEGTTPTSIFARGSYFVRSKFVDEKGKCYLDTSYYFDIRKDWGSCDKS